MRRDGKKENSVSSELRREEQEEKKNEKNKEEKVQKKKKLTTSHSIPMTVPAIGHLHRSAFVIASSNPGRSGTTMSNTSDATSLLRSASYCPRSTQSLRTGSNKRSTSSLESAPRPRRSRTGQSQETDLGSPRSDQARRKSRKEGRERPAVAQREGSCCGCCCCC